ncbi:MAG: phosphatidylserine decarboxylase [Pyrinomonadaceae bacterium]|nr:phosphatidylserine decarboxylase [Pyrinomonadaceae bacterium]MCX7639592.1 phosphatidylserine decarboxylase [Pyrinomonadaceae bacterium]MDW8303985.1 phosphatidylserine decarboxylase [Acidobacteriota bacterium]
MVREGIPFVLVPLGLAFVFAAFGVWLVVVPLVILSGFMAFFFRDPERKTPEDENIIVSAADGRVTKVEQLEDGKLVSVFLSPFDVHVNRAPISGRITKISYQKGKKLPATSNLSSKVNERNSLTIENEKMIVVCTQVAGILARRIVCWKHEGERVRIGERFGLIKFGSRTDLLIPTSTEVLVKVGDKVKAGETVIARIKND